MVLIAAAVCTKAGKTIISRQFVEMTRARIEGLLAAFPKLMTSGKQHTFVETEFVRYVYQPLEKLYMVLITTRASNILEDLETLRLFSKIIPEYSRSLEEKEIVENAFNLIFAFDEIVALGYRENVNLAQIKTFVEMDSHEEKVFQAVRQTQEREAKQKMREKVIELQRQRLEETRKKLVGRSFITGVSDSYSSSSAISNSSISSSSPSIGIGELKSSAPKPRTDAAKNIMKLGGKSKGIDSFVHQLENEGETVASASAPLTSITKTLPQVPTESIHLKMEDKLSVRLGRDGGVLSFELSGLLTLRISDEAFGRIKVYLQNDDQRGIQLQTHPNVDKDLFKREAQIGLKNPAKPFPLNTDVGVLKWRYQVQDESAIPLTINCWPTENGEGGCDVNIEYVLEHKKFELQDVCILIPIPSGLSPIVSDCVGDYHHDSRKNVLEWRLPIIDKNTSNGAIEFAVPSSIPGDFFPLQVSFVSEIPYADLQALQVTSVDNTTPLKYSVETIMHADKYEIV